MEEIQAVFLLIVLYHIANGFIESTLARRRALAAKQIQNAQNAGLKAWRRILQAIAEIDCELAETHSRHQAQRRWMVSNHVKQLMYQVIQEHDVTVDHISLCLVHLCVFLICEYYRRRPVLPSVWVHNSATEWWETVVPTFTEAQWIQNFRMSKDTFQYFCRRLQGELGRCDTDYCYCIPAPNRVSIALWKLATNSGYRGISHLFGVCISMVWSCVRDFCSAVETVLMTRVIQLPNREKLKEMAMYFERRWGLPQCVGAIDGSHIPILGPEQYHTEYFNRKGWHSIVLQAVVDGRGLFWNVFRWYTGKHAWCQSISPVWIVGFGG